MKKQIFLLALLFFTTLSAFAQKERLKFDHKLHDFGSVQEEGGKVSTRFFFKNETADSLQITNITVSCGCTSPEWAKGTLAPADTGSVLITFDPLDRPGVFEKHIGIEIDGKLAQHIEIRGFVEKRPEGPRDWYPFRQGNVWMKHEYMFLGNVLKDSTVVFDNILYNASDTALTVFPDEMKLPASISFEFPRKTIAPKDTLHFRMTYRAQLVENWGYVLDSVQLRTSDPEALQRQFQIGTVLKEKFATTGDFPKAVLVGTTLNLGDLTFGQVAEGAFELKNEGQAPLIIRALKPNCACLTVKAEKMIIQPGESGKIFVTFDSKDSRGYQRKIIGLVLNDPKMDFKNLVVTAEIP